MEEDRKDTGIRPAENGDMSADIGFARLVISVEDDGRDPALKTVTVGFMRDGHYDQDLVMVRGSEKAEGAADIVVWADRQSEDYTRMFTVKPWEPD